MNKIDLFGGTGFIGSNFKKMYNEETHVHERNDIIPVHDNVFYMISTTDNYNVLNDIYLDVNTNLIHLLKVLEYYKNNIFDKNKTIFNFVSSWFVYGKIYELPAKESSPCNPTGFYSITKKCAEDLLISFCKTYGLKYRILRLCNVYGKDDSKVSKKKNALQYILQKIKENQPIELYENGDFIRDYMYVDDVCRAIKLCVDKGFENEIINIGSGYPHNFRMIIDYAIHFCNSTSKITNIPSTDFHKIVQVKDMYLDVSKLKQLGFKSEISIEQGIESLLQ